MGSTESLPSYTETIENTIINEKNNSNSANIKLIACKSDYIPEIKEYSVKFFNRNLSNNQSIFHIVINNIDYGYINVNRKHEFQLFDKNNNTTSLIAQKKYMIVKYLNDDEIIACLVKPSFSLFDSYILKDTQKILDLFDNDKIIPVEKKNEMDINNNDIYYFEIEYKLINIYYCVKYLDKSYRNYCSNDNIFKIFKNNKLYLNLIIADNVKYIPITHMKYQTYLSNIINNTSRLIHYNNNLYIALK